MEWRLHSERGAGVRYLTPDRAKASRASLTPCAPTPDDICGQVPHDGKHLDAYATPLSPHRRRRELTLLDACRSRTRGQRSRWSLGLEVWGPEKSKLPTSRLSQYGPVAEVMFTVCSSAGRSRNSLGLQWLVSESSFFCNTVSR